MSAFPGFPKRTIELSQGPCSKKNQEWVENLRSEYEEFGLKRGRERRRAVASIHLWPVEWAG